MTQAISTTRVSMLRSPRRLLLAGLGLLCVGLALAGVFVPGLPTTVFLIAASYLFTRSCPWLEERMLGLRVFRPFVPYVRGDLPMPRRARIACRNIWTAGTSTTLAPGVCRTRDVRLSYQQLEHHRGWH